MGLREEAEADMIEIHENTNEFGWDIFLTDPDGVTVPVVGLANDIAQAIDPDTGLIISGRSASVSIPIQSITQAGVGLPVGISDPTSRPWTVTFDDILGTSWTFKISNTSPDRSLGNIVCQLEIYNGA